MFADDSAESYDIPYSPGDFGEPTVSIVEAVAEVTAVPVYELEPLHAVIDASLLGGIFGESGDDGRSITFQYEGCEITIDQSEVHVKSV